MKKVIGKIATAMTCLMMAAACCLPTMTHFAHAAEVHTHVYENGRCACGSALFEAENADLTGSVPSEGNDSNIGTNTAASGGGLVNNWSVAGNEIVWTFSIDKSVTAPLELVMSPCEAATTFSSVMTLTVNGASVAMKDDNIRGIEGEQWHNYSAFVTQDVAFKKGDIRIAIKAKRAYNVNIDCLRVDFAAADDVAVGAFNKMSTSEHTHIFSEGKCACGALLFEAEDGDVDGTPTFENPDFAGKNKAAHGGRLVGNWGNGDNVLTWTLNSEKAVTDAKIDLVIASGTENGDFALPTEASQTNGVIVWPFELRTEHAENNQPVKQTVYWEANGLATMPPDNWHDYRVYATKPFALAAGENKIKLESYNEYPMNIDYIVVSFPADEPPEPEHTHEFVDGRCSCGYALFEAETADLSGSRPSDSAESDCIGSNSAASGGGLVDNWAVAGNKIVWRFRIDRAVTAPLELVMSPCDPATTFSSTLSLTVNGVGVTMKDDNIRGIVGELWHNYTAFETNPVAIAAGNVEIALTAKRAYNVNIDALRVGLTPEVTVGAYEYRLEAEDGEVAGTSSDPNGEAMVAERAESSGGGLVKNFGTPGNKITWKFNLDKARENVDVALFMAPCDSAEKPISSIKLSVNGTAAAFADTTIPALVGEAYHDYRAFTARGVNLAKNNIIVFENVAGININVDYLRLGLPGGAVISDYTEPVPEHEHNFTDGVCTCGAVKLEAENAAVGGSPTGSDTFLEQTDKASGGWCIAGWKEGDNLLTFEVEVGKACEKVPLGFTFAPCGDAGVSYTLPTTTEGAVSKPDGTYWPFLLRVNGVGQGFTTTDVPTYAGGGNYYDWHTIYTNPVSLKEGKNTIEIEACDYYAMNLDYIVLEVKPDVIVTMKSVDNEDPKISAITVTPDSPKAGDEISFSFTVTDNITAADKIVVDAKVYLNYGREEAQREIACAGNKFTAAEAGKYTIIVTVQDESGRTTQKVRAFTVAAADNQTPDPEVPGGNETPGGEETPSDGCNGCGSFVGGTISAIVFALAALMFGIVRVIAKKKR